MRYILEDDQIVQAMLGLLSTAVRRHGFSLIVFSSQRYKLTFV